MVRVIMITPILEWSKNLTFYVSNDKEHDTLFI
jgi:hypothetical protein